MFGRGEQSLLAGACVRLGLKASPTPAPQQGIDYDRSNFREGGLQLQGL